MPGIDEALDHLVYATPDLEASVDRVENLTGVRPAEGGRHLGLGTRNYLLGLGGRRYLEIIGPDPDQPDPAGPRPFGIDDLTAAALVAWAIRAHPLEDRVARARERGHDPGDVVHMSRRTPDGELLEWRLAFSGGGLVPFLIDWGTTVHPADRVLPTVSLTSLTAVHPAPATIRTKLQAIDATLDIATGDPPSLTAVLTAPTTHATLT